MIEKYDGALQTESQVGVVHKLLNALLLEQTVDVREIARQVVVENDAADGGLNELPLKLDRNGVRHVLVVVRRGEVDDFTGVAQTNRSEQFDFTGFEREHDFFDGAEDAALALGAGARLGQVIDTKNHVLRRNRE